MEAEDLPWRSFADDGTIGAQWSFPMTPTFYLIDHTGKIRSKWVGSPGEESIDAAVAVLILEAEEG